MARKTDSVTRRVDLGWKFGLGAVLAVAVGVAFPETPLALGLLIGPLLGIISAYNGLVAAVAEGVRLGQSDHSA